MFNYILFCHLNVCVMFSVKLSFAPSILMSHHLLHCMTSLGTRNTLTASSLGVEGFPLP